MNRVGGTAENTGKRFDRFRAVAATAGIVAGAALVKFGKDSIQAFKESQAAQLRLEDAFRRFPNLADSNIQAFQKLNNQLQLKTRFDDEAYASGQAILAQFKLTGKQVLEVTPLLGDLAAKLGIDVPTAATQLGKAFLGNTRALKTLGISYKTTGNQAQDTANIIDLVRQQVGGFAEKEGKTAAGQTAILGNKFNELQEQVGAKLLPALTTLIGLASGVLDVFGKLSPEVQTAVLVIAALGVAALIAGPQILTLAVAVKEVGISASTAVPALVGLTAAFMMAQSEIKLATDDSKSFVEKIGGFVNLGVGTGLINDLAHNFGLVGDKSKDAAAGTDVAKTAADQYREILGPVTDAVGGLAEETQNAFEAQQLLNGVLLDATETDISVRDAIASWTQKVREATKAGEKHTHSLSLNNQAGRDNVSALTDMAKKVDAHAQAVFDQTGSVDKANRALRTDRERLLDAADAAGFNRTQVQRLIDRYLKIPTRKATNIVQPGMRRALNDTLLLKGYVDGLHSKTVTVSVNTNFIGGQGGGRAFLQHGGPVWPGGAFVVGEAGPELFMPNVSGRIIPNGGMASMARMSSHSGSVTNVTVNTGGVVGMTKMDLENQLVRILNTVAGQGRLNTAVRLAAS